MLFRKTPVRALVIRSSNQPFSSSHLHPLNACCSDHSLLLPLILPFTLGALDLLPTCLLTRASDLRVRERSAAAWGLHQLPAKLEHNTNTTVGWCPTGVKRCGSAYSAQPRYPHKGERRLVIFSIRFRLMRSSNAVVGATEAKEIIIITHNCDGKRSGMSTMLLVLLRNHLTTQFAHL